MEIWEAYRPELLSLTIVIAVVGGVLGVYHYDGMALVGLANVLFALVFLSFGLLRVLAVAEGVFLLEAITVSTVTPLLFEWSVRYELVGLALAAAFVVGVVCHQFTTTESRGTV